MPTAACGINCDVCRAYIEGKCPTDGCVEGSKASQKLEKQKTVFGFVCPVLECASKKGLDFCLRDCEDFPCEIFYKANSPYSKEFLDVMKKIIGKG
ncbi:MAG: DUF3795 domain-containing protein [Candidatus Bathyarchaeota archaeon]|nr:DUF3795 domain-containing protein [Candidatus Bathyarchaeota archaeon]